MVSNPKASALSDQCNLWLEGLLANEVMVAIPEIADYEVRRELLRVGSRRGVDSLDAFKDHLFYLPITTESMLKAADFWAAVRRQGIRLPMPRRWMLTSSLPRRQLSLPPTTTRWL